MWFLNRTNTCPLPFSLPVEGLGSSVFLLTFSCEDSLCNHTYHTLGFQWATLNDAGGNNILVPRTSSDAGFCQKIRASDWSSPREREFPNNPHFSHPA